ncbi:MAG: hypothetical protein ERJ69_02860 [Aphanocapsa feldmannii 288cV]|nr:MAG: hypothetical protein ERJ69_02860 [Aphanocapsa feldmannii 288cV]
MFALATGLLTFLWGTMLLLLPLLLPDLSRGLDQLWGILVLILGLAWVSDADQLDGVSTLGVLITGLLLTRLSLEIAQGRWQALSDEQRRSVIAGEAFSPQVVSGRLAKLLTNLGKGLQLLSMVRTKLIQLFKPRQASSKQWVRQEQPATPTATPLSTAQEERGGKAVDPANEPTSAVPVGNTAQPDQHLASHPTRDGETPARPLSPREGHPLGTAAPSGEPARAAASEHPAGMHGSSQGPGHCPAPHAEAALAGTAADSVAADSADEFHPPQEVDASGHGSKGKQSSAAPLGTVPFVVVEPLDLDPPEPQRDQQRFSPRRSQHPLAPLAVAVVRDFRDVDALLRLTTAATPGVDQPPACIQEPDPSA